MNTLNTASCRTCIYSSPLFEGLKEEELEYLVKYSSQKSYKKGVTVLNEGDPITFISFLKEGLLKLYKRNHLYHDQIISIAKPNDCVGLLSVFSGDNFNYNLAAIEDSVLYTVEMSAIKYILFKNGASGLNFLRSVSKAADQVISQTIEMSKKNSRGRVAFSLLTFSEDIYQRTTFELPVSRKEIAELIGLTTENVIRVFSEFRRDGIIGIQGKTISILDTARLKAIEKNG